MSVTWHSEVPPVVVAPSGLGWLRVILRGLPILVTLTVGLLVLLALRLIEAPLFRQKRPVTPWITVAVCRAVLILLGLRWNVSGQPDPNSGFLLANHVSWSDIFVLNAVRPLYFVAKSEVASWPGIGLLARATGTVFISRDRKQAAEQAAILRERLGTGHRLLLFPEGTSSDGRRVLPFRSAMFGALDGLSGDQRLQPITLIYHAPEGADPRFYGWWGEMEMAPHLLQLLAAPRQGRVDIVHHASIAALPGTERKALARQVEQSVRAGLIQALPPEG